MLFNIYKSIYRQREKVLPEREAIMLSIKECGLDGVIWFEAYSDEVSQAWLYQEMLKWFRSGYQDRSFFTYIDTNNNDGKVILYSLRKEYNEEIKIRLQHYKYYYLKLTQPNIECPNPQQQSDVESRIPFSVPLLSLEPAPAPPAQSNERSDLQVGQEELSLLDKQEKQLEQELSDEEKKYHECEQKIQRCDNELKEHKEAINKIKEEISTAKAELEKIKIDLQALREKHKSHLQNNEKKLTTVDANIEKCKQKIREKNEQLQKIQKKLKQREEEYEGARKEIAEFDELINESLKEIERLKTNYNSRNTVDIEKAKQTLQDIDTNIQKFRNKIAKLLNDFSLDHTDQLQNLNKQLGDLEDQRIIAANSLIELTAADQKQTNLLQNMTNKEQRSYNSLLYKRQIVENKSTLLTKSCNVFKSRIDEVRDELDVLEKEYECYRITGLVGINVQPEIDEKTQMAKKLENDLKEKEQKLAGYEFLHNFAESEKASCSKIKKELSENITRIKNQLAETRNNQHEFVGNVCNQLLQIFDEGQAVATTLPCSENEGDTASVYQGNQGSTQTINSILDANLVPNQQPASTEVKRRKVQTGQPSPTNITSQPQSSVNNDLFQENKYNSRKRM